ncbi:kinase-like domain-containing protein [Roridomyces roridus]|uniref:cAMP-dependent protein kinase n=1 Tax=Roridomyces roridus TaxID=1738132 RepID=A0AAD7BXG7_9AGAR|nr:kinase-like domain-containing protein [Roridomyces roridus]
MAPIRTIPSIRLPDSKIPAHVRPPIGYNHKRVVDGIQFGARFKANFKHDKRPRKRVNGLRPEDPRGPPPKLSDLELVKMLGKGGNGQVILVRTKASTVFALKSVRKKQLRTFDMDPNPSERDNERSILVHMEWNPFVTGVLQAFHDDRNVYMMLEYSPCGSLDEFIGRPFATAHALFYFANIVCGLEFLEKLDIIHRDLKPGNILVGPDGYLQLCDFGTAEFTPAPGDGTTAEDWINQGTAPYQSPECFGLKRQPSNMRLGAAIDWWAAGVTLFEMLTGKLPFPLPAGHVSGAAMDSEGCTMIWEQIMAGPPRWPARVSPPRNLGSLLMGLLTIDANERLGAGGAIEVRRHPWLAAVDWNKMWRKRYIPPRFVTPKQPDFLPARGVEPKHFLGLRVATR